MGQMATVTVEGRGRLAYERDGQGAPTIVLVGYVRDHFRSVFSDLTTFGTVVSYDRGGYGDSDLSPQETDALRSRVGELHDLLRVIEAPHPFVLVGFSIGALIAQLFAIDHPDEVAGIVSIDGDDGIPTDLPEWPVFPPEVEAEALARLFANVPPDIRDKTMPPPPESLAAMTADAMGRQAAFDRLAAAREANSLPDVPFVHLGATGHFFGPDDLLPVPPEVIRQKLLDKHRRTAAAYPQGVFVEAGTGHYVQFDRPDLVIDAVAHIVTTASTNEG